MAGIRRSWAAAHQFNANATQKTTAPLTGAPYRPEQCGYREPAMCPPAPQFGRLKNVRCQIVGQWGDLHADAEPADNTAMHPRRRFPLFASLLLLSIASTAAEAPKPAPKYELVDGHLHFLTFVQETAGLGQSFKAMDDTGVVESVVIGRPGVKKW